MSTNLWMRRSEACRFRSIQASSGVRDPLDTHAEDRRFSGYQSDGGERRRLIQQPRSNVISIMGVCVRKNPGAVKMATLRALVTDSLFSGGESHEVVTSSDGWPYAELADGFAFLSAAVAVDVSMNRRVSLACASEIATGSACVQDDASVRLMGTSIRANISVLPNGLSVVNAGRC